MKKFTLAVLAMIASWQFCFGQVTIYSEAPQSDGGTSANRGPNGTSAHAYLRACALVLQSELSGLAPNTVITSFGFTLNSGTNSNATAGTFTLYLQNTADATYNKGTNFATAISGMTTVYASAMTIPVSASSTSVVVMLSTPFTYTGGAMYVAYDWASSGPFDLTAAVYRCNYLGLTPGAATAASGASAPATLSTTNFRPCFLWGRNNPYTNDMAVMGIEANGRIASGFNQPQIIKALVRNSSSATLTNVNVNLNVTGANVFSDVKTVSTLAPGAVTTVTFNAYTPTVLGANTVSVSVNSDQNNGNNSGTYSQSVTCNEWGYNPATGAFTGGVGFGAGSGILAVPFLNPVTSTLTGIRTYIGSDAPSIGNNVYGVLLSSSGVVLATSNTVAISSLSTSITFTFAAGQSLSANTTYYFGLAQTANTTAYYPAGTLASAFMPITYYTTALGGGALSAINVNYGYFGIEGLFENNSGITVASTSPSLCAGNSATLSAGGVSSYTWSTGLASQNLVISPSTNTVYTVSGTNTIGCKVSTGIAIPVSTLIVTATSNTNAVCLGSSVSFTANGASTYSWTNGTMTVNTAVFSDTPANTSTYTVTGANAAGCTQTAAVSITVNSFTNLSVPASAAVCLGGSLSLTASGASSYTWETGSNTVNTPAISFTPAASTVYTVSGADNNGCMDSRMVNITVNSFTLQGIPASTVTCHANNFTLIASGATSYTWQTPNGNFNTPTIVTVLTASTIYTLSATDNAGCMDTKTIAITVNSFTPVITTPTTICQGASLTLSVSGSGPYVWTPASSLQSFTVSPTVTTGYSVTSVGPNGCTGKNETLITVNPSPTVMATADRTVMCVNEENKITVSGANTYSWNAGSTSTVTVITPTLNTVLSYTITGYNNLGCSHTTTIAVKAELCTGIRNTSEQITSVAVFPNPSNGSVNIRLGSSLQNASVKIYNSLGSLVKEAQLNSEDNRIDLQSHANGIYFVYVLQNNTPIHVSRIVKN